MQKYAISRIVFPGTEHPAYTDLFVRKFDTNLEMNGQYTSVHEYQFNTWMNMLAAKKYYQYCDLGRLYLVFDIEGDYTVQVKGSNRNIAYNRFDTILAEESFTGPGEMMVPDAQNYEGVFFTIFAVQPIKINSIHWATDKAPVRDNKLAIVSCTFKREQYINKTIKVFEDFISQNPDLKEKIQFYVVDNGQTLDPARSNDMTTILPNMNAGGAGGFTRGLMEVMKSGRDFSRVLFIDDDVEIFAESFFRVLVLTNYLKEEFNDAFLNGAMLDLYRKDFFFENLSRRNGLWVCQHIGSADIRNYDNILKTNDIHGDIFESLKHQNERAEFNSAWWFCCFSVKIVKEKGLPLPVFFRGDDTEWGWRHTGTHIISFNGICVWHAPFEYRVTKVADYYYLTRNMFMLNSIYNSDFKQNFERYFIDRFKYLINTYDYNTVEITLRAMDDILKGSDVYRENPEEQYKEINAIMKKIQYFPAAEPELEHIKHRRHYTKVKKFRKLLWKLTSKGLNAPNFLLKKRSSADEWYPPIENFILTKEVKVFNLFTSKYTVRKLDRKLAKQYQKDFYDRLNKIKANYDTLQADYIKAHKEFSTFEFWENYLDLKNK